MSGLRRGVIPTNQAFGIVSLFLLPFSRPLTISAELHHAVTALSPEDQRDRAKVNRAAAEIGKDRSKA